MKFIVCAVFFVCLIYPGKRDISLLFKRKSVNTH